MASIDIDKLVISVMAELENFAGATHEIVEASVKETAKYTANELKATSPVGDTGDYAKSWGYKRDAEGRKHNKFNMIVFSEKPNYRLTHLLEFGHAKVNGGRVAAQPHIKNAEENAEAKLLQKIKSGIAGIG